MSYRKFLRPISIPLILLIAISLYLRMTLFASFPIFFAADSWEYLSISQDISQLNFYTKALGEWRLPGYPIFLTFVDTLVKLNPEHVVVAQKLIALSTIILMVVIGYRLRSYIVAIILSIFLAINPIYLLNEHVVMTENLFLCFLVLFSLIAIVCLHTKGNLIWGFLLGLSAIVVILIRANGLFFCFPVIAFILWEKINWVFPNSPNRQKVYNKNKILQFAVGIFLGIFLLLGPWLWRNYNVYNRFVPFTYNTNLNMLIYATEHNLVDPTLPKTEKYAKYFDPASPENIYNLLWKFRADIIKGEQEGTTLLKEQISHHPKKYFQETGYSLFHFIGYPVPGVTSGRDDTIWWFNNFVINVTAIHELNERFYISTNTPAAYISQRTDTNLHQFWAKTGVIYLSSFRKILTTIFFILLGIYLIKTFRHYNQSILQRQIILIFSLSYIITIIIHSISLSDYDRFAVPFDWIPLLVICLIMEEFFYFKLSPTP